MFRFALLLFALTARADDLADQIRAAQASGNYAQAAHLYLQLINEGTDTPEIRSNCGVMLQLARRSREALEQLKIALARDPSLASANLFAALAELDLGAPSAALGYAQQARKLDPSRPTPLLVLGRARLALRQFAAAHQAFAEASDMDPRSGEAWYGVGITDRSLADEQLNRAAREGHRSSTQPAEVQTLLREATEALTRAMELEPDAPRTHLIVAESLADSGKIPEAVAEYQTALRLDPNAEGAELGLATLYWKQRQFDEALPILHRLLTRTPRDPEVNGMLADILQHDNRDDEAERRAQLALAGNPDLIETHVVLARIYLQRNRPQLAIAQLQKVANADPDGSYHFLLYRAYRQAGNDHDAQLALARFQQLKAGAANSQPAR